MSEKLTPAQRKALEWLIEHEPVSMFPFDGVAPRVRFVSKLVDMGLAESIGVEPGRFGFTKFAVSEAGRAALMPSPKPGKVA